MDKFTSMMNLNKKRNANATTTSLNQAIGQHPSPSTTLNTLDAKVQDNGSKDSKQLSNIQKHSFDKNQQTKTQNNIANQRQQEEKKLSNNDRRVGVNYVVASSSSNAYVSTKIGCSDPNIVKGENGSLSTSTTDARITGEKRIRIDDIPIIASTPPGTLEVAFNEIVKQRKYIEEYKQDIESMILVFDIEFNSISLGMNISRSRVNINDIFVASFGYADAPSLKVNAIKIGDIIVSIQSGSKWITIDGDLDRITKFISSMPRPITIRFIRLNEANVNLPTLQGILEDEKGMRQYFLEYLHESRRLFKGSPERTASQYDGFKARTDILDSAVLNKSKIVEQMPTNDSTSKQNGAKITQIEKQPENLQLNSITLNSRLSETEDGRRTTSLSNTESDSVDENEENIEDRDFTTDMSHEGFVFFYLEAGMILDALKKRELKTVYRLLGKLFDKYVRINAPFPIRFKPSLAQLALQMKQYKYDLQDASMGVENHVNADQSNEENANANNVDIDEAEVGKITSMIEVLRSDALSFLENSYRRFLHSSQALSMFNKFDIKYVKNPLFINITVDIILTSRPLCNIFLFYLLQNESHRPLVCWMYLNYSLITAVENVKLLIDNSISNINSSASLFEVSKYEDDNDGKILVDRVNNMKQKLFVLATKYFENDHQHQVISSNIRSSLQLLIARIDSIPVDKVSPEFLNEIKDIILNVTKEIVKINEACRNILKENFQDFKEDFNSMYTTVANIVRKIDNHEIPRISTILQESKLPDYITIHRLPSSEYSPSLFSLKSLSNKQQNILKYALIYRTDEASMTLTSELISSNVEEGTQMLNLNTKSITNFFVPEGIHAFGAVADSPSQGPYPPNPYIFNFVIGNGGGPKGNNKLYGTSLVSYEKASQGVLFLPIGVCLLSDFPVFQSMRRWIETNLFDKEVKYPNVSTEAVKTIANYSSSHRISSFVSTDSLNIASQKDELEPLDFQLLLLFRALKAENVISLFAQCLLERKILLVSKSYSVLLAVGESLRALLHPFAWSHVYAPVLPRANLDLLQCPTPFIIGIHQSYAFKKDFPFATDLVVVDLDNDSITVPQFATVGSTPALVSSDLHFPTKIAIDMKQRLHIALNPSLFFADQIDAADYCTDAIIVRNVRNIFDDAMKELTKNLSKCCINCEHPTENLVLLHELQLLNLYTDQEERMFMQQLIKTQSFSDFICSINNL